MSKTIKMPTDRGSRIAVEINGEKHIYAAGVEYTVSDAVAAAIADSLAMKPKPNQSSAKDAYLAEVSAAAAAADAKAVAAQASADGLDTRLTALDGATTGKVPVLEAAVESLDERVTALEPEPDPDPDPEGT